MLMLSIYNQSSLYKIPRGKCRPILHKEAQQSKFLVLLHLDVAIQPEIVEMLEKIRMALKLNTSDCEYLVFNSPIILSDWQRMYEADNVLVFGAVGEDLNIQYILQNYEVYAFDSYKLLLVNQIMDVYNNQQLKTRLWKSLQEMFS